MRFALVALAGLAAISGNLGVDARAVSNGLVQRAGGVPVVPRPDPVAPKPVTPEPVRPEPNAPEPVVPSEPIAPEPVTPNVVGADEDSRASTPMKLMSDSDESYFDSSPPDSPLRETPFNFKTTTIKIDSDAGTEDNPCGISVGGMKAKRAGVDTKTAADAPTGWAKIYYYLENFSDIDRTKIVFFSGNAGEIMARNFIKENPEYRFFYDIFGGKGAVQMGQHLLASGLEDTIPQDEGSKALATFARNPIVFNADAAKDTSWWKTLELPRMFAAGEIIKMNDNALKIDDVAGNIALPPTPKEGNTAGC